MLLKMLLAKKTVCSDLSAGLLNKTFLSLTIYGLRNTKKFHFQSHLERR